MFAVAGVCNYNHKENISLRKKKKLATLSYTKSSHGVQPETCYHKKQVLTFHNKQITTTFHL